MKFLNNIELVIIGVMSVTIYSCSKNETEKWNHNETYTYTRSDFGDDGYYSDDSDTHRVQLVVGPYTVPDDGVIFVDNVFRNFKLTELGLEIEYLVPDYEVVSDFMLISSNFENFLAPNEISIEYTHHFHYMEVWDDYSYHYHNDLALYQINHNDDVEEQLINMNSWIPIPFTFHDTLSAGQGTIKAQITDPNALYVVARKYDY